MPHAVGENLSLFVCTHVNMSSRTCCSIWEGGHEVFEMVVSMKLVRIANEQQVSSQIHVITAGASV